MRVCIVGAGAIGARLAAAGDAEVCAVARGETLAALRSHGWRLRQGDELIQSPAHASDDPIALGAQDLVVIAVKGPALAQVAASIAPLLGADTMVMPAMNGVPWWFANGVAGFGDEPLASVDPGGAIARAIALRRVVGCVVHASLSTAGAGFVQHHMGRGLIVGEAAGGESERVRRVADLLGRAGFDVTHSPNVRRDIWYKLWGNMTINPITAMTGATGDRVLADPLVREFCSACMREASAIGARIGCPIEQSPEERHRITAKLGAFTPSMLQDARAGRAIELDALVSVVSELGKRTRVATPCVDALLGLSRLFGRAHGLYPPGA